MGLTILGIFILRKKNENTVIEWGIKMSYSRLIEGIKRYGTDERDLCFQQFNCSWDKINENVIIAPWWKPILFREKWSNIIEITKDKVWNIESDNGLFTYIRTGIGAPLIGDYSLILGTTLCKKAIFIGSVGALNANMKIGEIIIPEVSFCGDGFSRYLTDMSLAINNCYGQQSYPDAEMLVSIKEATEKICLINDVGYHHTKVFSTDSIFAQFAHIDEIIDTGCNAIEMETAAFFTATKICGIKAGAILQVSDNTVVNKSLYSGRTEDEQGYRKQVRKNVIPLIIEDTFKQM